MGRLSLSWMKVGCFEGLANVIWVRDWRSFLRPLDARKLSPMLGIRMERVVEGRLVSAVEALGSVTYVETDSG